MEEAKNGGHHSCNKLLLTTIIYINVLFQKWTTDIQNTSKPHSQSKTLAFEHTQLCF